MRGAASSTHRGRGRGACPVITGRGDVGRDPYGRAGRTRLLDRPCRRRYATQRGRSGHDVESNALLCAVAMAACHLAADISGVSALVSEVGDGLAVRRAARSGHLGCGSSGSTVIADSGDVSSYREGLSRSPSG